MLETVPDCVVVMLEVPVGKQYMSDPEARMCLILWNDTIMWKYVSPDLIVNKTDFLDRYWIINIVPKLFLIL